MRLLLETHLTRVQVRIKMTVTGSVSDESSMQQATTNQYCTIFL
jgi:hypothetical protein